MFVLIAGPPYSSLQPHKSSTLRTVSRQSLIRGATFSMAEVSFALLRCLQVVLFIRQISIQSPTRELYDRSQIGKLQ